MQLIIEIPISAEDYVSQSFQENIAPPAACPHCQACVALEALGYYQRSITSRKSTLLRLSIRRFRCRTCNKTVSILPAFAQPYRLVQNRAIHRYFCGQRKGEDVTPWLMLLRRYWRRFSWWVSRTDTALGNLFQHAPPSDSPDRWWEAVLALYADMIVATRLLVTDFQVTLFGQYRCHRPNIPL